MVSAIHPTAVRKLVPTGGQAEASGRTPLLGTHYATVFGSARLKRLLTRQTQKTKAHRLSTFSSTISPAGHGALPSSVCGLLFEFIQQFA
jgi:hypothetical protein